MQVIPASLSQQPGYSNTPTGLLTKAQPNPWVGFWWAGLGGGRVLARPTLNYNTHHTALHLVILILSVQYIA